MNVDKKDTSWHCIGFSKLKNRLMKPSIYLRGTNHRDQSLTGFIMQCFMLFWPCLYLSPFLHQNIQARFPISIVAS